MPIEPEEKTQKAAQSSGLSPRSFAVAWGVREDKTLATAHLVSQKLAKTVEKLLKTFPNLDVNPKEKRAFRSRLYKPLIQAAYSTYG